LYEKALEYVHDRINAVDVGCRDGEFTRYLSWSFDHVHAFDYRRRIYFAMNIDITKNKVTHYTCALGEHIATEYASGRGNFRSTKVDPRWKNKQQKIYTLDYFDLKDINLIKIDVDGMDGEVIKGAIETIQKYKPVIIIEEISSTDGMPNHDGVAVLEKLGYKIAYVHKSDRIHKDYVMVPSLT
jgi:FkbM family methyltransferase